jgi:hypothetical protein
MAIINKTGITTGGTIEAEHVTRAIDALSGGSTDTIVATGSFSGSLQGTASFATSTSMAVSSSFATTASFATSASRAVSSSLATTASFALNVGAGAVFPFTGSARISGSLGVTGSASITGSLRVADSFAASGSYLEVTAQNFLINASSVLVGTSVTGSTVSFGSKSILSLRNMNTGLGFVIPLTASNNPDVGSMYFDNTIPALYIHDGTQWTFITLGT